MSSARKFATAIAVIVLLFSKPLFDLVQFAFNSTMYSHVVLIPFIAAYLASLRWKTAMAQSTPSGRVALITVTIGFVLLAAAILFARTTEVRLCLSTTAFVSSILAAALQFLGWQVVRQLAFPFALLFFMIPFPPFIMNGLESFFQHASAFAAAMMMKVTGLPAIRDGLFFFLPGFSIEVAQECSGVRSTLVLFITSLIAGYLLLSRPRDRAILAAAIVPLAILRNGFRIFSLAWLSVEVNPDIIDSALHHRGGPIFFALSLIPLFLLLLLLRKLEKKPVYAS